MTPAEIAYDLASYAASPLHLPAAYRGQRTIACRHYTDRPATEEEIADLCEAGGVQPNTTPCLEQSMMDACRC
jgi:hypothetical protein